MSVVGSAAVGLVSMDLGRNGGPNDANSNPNRSGLSVGLGGFLHTHLLLGYSPPHLSFSISIFPVPDIVFLQLSVLSVPQ